MGLSSPSACNTHPHIVCPQRFNINSEPIGSGGEEVFDRRAEQKSLVGKVSSQYSFGPVNYPQPIYANRANASLKIQGCHHHYAIWFTSTLLCNFQNCSCRHYKALMSDLCQIIRTSHKLLFKTIREASECFLHHIACHTKLRKLWQVCWGYMMGDSMMEEAECCEPVPWSIMMQVCYPLQVFMISRLVQCYLFDSSL